MKQPIPHRARLILAAGAGVQIFLGIPSAWGVFRQPVMEEYGLSPGLAEAAFIGIIGAFGVGGVLGGLLLDRRGPRAAGLLGTGLVCLGFVLAALLPAGCGWRFCLGFSLPVGLGSACLYPAVMGCAQQWMAGHKGLATGIIGGAVGASGGVLTLLVRFVSGRWGIRACFWGLGGLLLLLCGGGSLLLKEPPGAAPGSQGQRASLAPRQLLHSRAFWLCFGAAGFAAPSVLLFSPILPELARQRGLGEGAALWCITLGSLGSAGGRLLMPLLSDRLGRRPTDRLLFVLLAALGVGFWLLPGWWMVALYCGLTFCYAGETALLPSLCTDLFGMRHTGFYYGLTALGVTVGSVVCPLLAHLLDGEAGRHWVAIGAALAGLGCMLALRPPPEGQRGAEQTEP